MGNSFLSADDLGHQEKLNEHGRVSEPLPSWQSVNGVVKKTEEATVYKAPGHCVVQKQPLCWLNRQTPKVTLRSSPISLRAEMKPDLTQHHLKHFRALQMTSGWPIWGHQ